MSFRVSDHVTRVNYTTYAVGVQTGRSTRWKPASPAAAWYTFSGIFHPAGGAMSFRVSDRVTRVNYTTYVN